MKLNDGYIYDYIERGDLVIEPLDIDVGKGDKITQIEESKQIQPASVDIRLGNSLEVYNDVDKIDVKNMPEPDEIRTGEELILKPKEFALASTVEWFEIPDYLAAEVKGRSSVGRAGFHIHTAGWVDPDFKGEITLELVNHTTADVTLYSGMRIGQIVFDYLIEPAVVGYGDKDGSKYQGQKGPTASRLDKDFQ